jgi:hypothetical protein
VCSEGYAFRAATHECESCASAAGLDAVTILILGGIVLSVITAAIVYSRPDIRAKVKSVDDVYLLVFSSLRLLDRNAVSSATVLEEDVKTIRRRFQARVKIYIILWQIISLLPFTLDLDFPNVYEGIAAVLNLCNMGVNVSSLVSCSSESSVDALDNLIFITTMPIVLVAMFWGIRMIHISMKKKENSADLSRISSRYFNIFLVFTYLILPFTSVTIFQTFSCTDVDPDDVSAGDHSYMTMDYSVSCTASKYKFGLAWAIVCIFIYPVGIPLYYFYVLYSARSAIMARGEEGTAAERSSGEVLRPIQLLFEFYKPNFWYWEVVETVNRLLLTGVLVVIAQGSAVQIIVGTVFSMFFLKLSEFYRPYLDDKVQIL